MREIVTIQVGDYANYIGSHFWNFQDELLGLASLAEEPHGDPIYRSSSMDMGVLYRMGETPQGVQTCNPRLISVGLQGSLGSLSSSGSLYNVTSSDSSNIQTWTGDVSRHISEPHKHNLFLQSLNEEEQENVTDSLHNADEEKGSSRQDRDKDIVKCLENNVEFWTDYAKAYYHPKSLYQLHGSWSVPPTFDNYGMGNGILSEGLQNDEVSERLRFFVEECDHVQGIQFMVDDSGGFSSVSADILENIADEYSNIPLLLYSVRDPSAHIYSTTEKQPISRALHDAVSFSRLSSFCKLIVPVGLPSITSSKFSSYLRVEDHKPFYSSAVYAASIHSISIPFRMELLGPAANPTDVSGAVDIGGMTQMLTSRTTQNTVAILDAAIPAPSLKGGSILRSLHSLTPEIEDNVDDSQGVESLIIHGALQSGSHRASISQVNDSVIDEYQNGGLPRPIFSHLSVSLSPLPIPLPFPLIFKSRVGQHGELEAAPAEGEGAQLRGSLEIDSIPMAARLRSSRAILPFIERRLGSLRRYGMGSKGSGAELLRGWGFGREEIDEMGEVLAGMAKAVDPYSQASSGSDSD